MRVCLIAIAKMENDYINDWVKYHLNLGIDRIYLYDNNTDGYEFVGTRIESQLLNNVEIINVHKESRYQISAYNDFLDKYKDSWDYCLILDLDEFFTMEKFSNIKDFLSQKKFNKYFDVIKFNWKSFGDDNIIFGDKSIPIYDRIKVPISSYYNWQGDIYTKSIFNCKSNYLGFNVSSHFPDKYVNDLIQLDSKGRLLPKGTYNKIKTIDWEDAYIRHYCTKTLSEFIESKLKRGNHESAVQSISLDYFFRRCTKTPEKLKYLNDLGIQCN